MNLISLIPERFKNGFKELSLMPEETFKEVEASLLSVSLTSSVDDLTARIVGEKSFIDEEKLQEIFLSVEGLIPFLEDRSQIEDIASDVTELSEPKDAEIFRNRLIKLLGNNKIFLASKAQELVTETENLFLSGRIVTDIRPIFGINLDEQPIAGMIMHNLHLHYQGSLSGQQEDIYLSLNSTDISLLIDALVRADKKADNLKAMLLKIGMIDLNE